MLVRRDLLRLTADRPSPATPVMGCPVCASASFVAYAASILWDWITRDEFDEFIRDQTARFHAMHEGT